MYVYKNHSFKLTFTQECPFKKDTQVIGEDKVDRKKLSYFVPLEDAGVGQGTHFLLFLSTQSHK